MQKQKRKANGRYAKDETKNIVAVMVTVFIVVSIAFFAKEQAIRHNMVLVEQARAETTAQLPALDRHCLLTGQGTGKLQSYCADTPERLAEVIKGETFNPPNEAQNEPVTKSVEAYITQYSRADSCHNVVNGKCLMASGKPVYVGAVACPRNLKLGTQVKINGTVYTCEDRYATWLDAKRGLPTFDIFVETDPKGLYKTTIIIL